MTGAGGYPRRFDSYVLLKPLARGGMGQLYLALSGTPGLEKLCVIKQVIPELVAPENARRFRDEAMVALRLAHGNMVSVFDAGLEDGQIFLAMDHVDGKDLLATWNRCAERRVPFPVDISVYIVKEIARALVYAHAFEDLKLVHRDVSPANVLLSYTGEVKLTDFGLAMSILKMERTTPGVVYGKLSYLAPEQARRQPLDGRVDIYSAGILLWELLTGRQLFPVASEADVGNVDAMARAREPKLVPPSTIAGRVPPALDRIVMRALAPEREDRYPTAELLRADLAAFLGETAPKTDADRLAGFLRSLFGEDARAERNERERLIGAARVLLSGAIRAEATTGGAMPADQPRQTGGDPRIGTTLGGRYHVRRLCGEGAMGRVYEAQHIDIGRRVAIKVLHARFHHSADLVERFRREARAASKIGHPNIVDVTDSGTTPDGAFYFVMEYLDGINLEDLIADKGPLSVERALLVAAQIARALEAAHGAEIVHRDLKPANIMLVNRSDEEDFVKVLDFGISKDLDLAVGAALTRPDVAIGTPVYMAPEQAAGRTADALTDVYGVGGLLYEMLTGAAPCVGEDAIDVLQRKANEDPKPIGQVRPNLPRDVQNLVNRALSRNPAGRHPNMTALKENILACLAAAEGAPAPLRLPASGLSTPRLPAGAVETGRTLHGHLLRVQLRPSIIVVAAALGAIALLTVRFTRQTSVAEAARTAAPATAVAVVPAATHLPAARPSPPAVDPGPIVAALPRAPHRTVAAAGRPAKKAAPASTATPTATTTRIPGPGADPATLLSRGQIAFDRGDYKEAIHRGREAIAAGAVVGGRLLIGDAYLQLERYQEAVQEYDAALALDPGDSSARRRRELALEKAAR
ncbi:MAG TPA: serine/threonine-protein kinase [Polyangia bacterium]|nr:serine/threonine-protein kinase [Polyangia bacterium]